MIIIRAPLNAHKKITIKGVYSSRKSELFPHTPFKNAHSNSNNNNNNNYYDNNNNKNNV